MEIILSNKKDEMLNQLSLMENTDDSLLMLDLFDQFISLVILDKKLVAKKDYKENIRMSLAVLESFRDNKINDDFKNILMVWKKFIVKK